MVKCEMQRKKEKKEKSSNDNIKQASWKGEWYVIIA